MKFAAPLIPAKFEKRYKRFFVDATLADGTTVTAHCPNTGSMKGLLTSGNTVWLTHNPDPKRKLHYTTEIIEVDGHPVGINTGHPNLLVAEAIADGKIESLPADWVLRREQKYGENSRIDVLLESPSGQKCFIEVKNVTLREGDAALFPDAVTERGTKHLRELAAQARGGHRAVMFYLAQRADCTHFAPAAHIDPTYAAALKEAMADGLEVLAYTCTVTPTAIEIATPLPLKL